jgi:hypothetical protein
VDNHAFRGHIRNANLDLFRRIDIRRHQLQALKTVGDQFLGDREVGGLLQNVLTLALEIGEAEMVSFESIGDLERGASVVLKTPERRMPCELRLSFVTPHDCDTGFVVMVSVRLVETGSEIFRESRPFNYGTKVNGDILPWLERAIYEATAKLLEAAVP